MESVVFVQCYFPQVASELKTPFLTNSERMIYLCFHTKMTYTVVVHHKNRLRFCSVMVPNFDY